MNKDHPQLRRYEILEESYNRLYSSYISLTVISLIMILGLLFLLVWTVHSNVVVKPTSGWHYTADGKYSVLVLSREKVEDISVRKGLSAVCSAANKPVCISQLDQMSRLP